MNELRNALERIGKWADQMEDRISELKDRNLKMTQEEEGELRGGKIKIKTL